MLRREKVNDDTEEASDIKPDEKSFVNMDSVVSDLNSFLASTRRAISSPASQKKNGSLPGGQGAKPEDRSSPLSQENLTGQQRSTSLNNSLTGLSKNPSTSNFTSLNSAQEQNGNNRTQNSFESSNSGSFNIQSTTSTSNERKGNGAQEKLWIPGNKVQILTQKSTL